ncbi:MAG TPA: SLC13 family permease [Myxococcota bacterium]|nr:SLC13 family permease [Myxococcota bacterium]
MSEPTPARRLALVLGPLVGLTVIVLGRLDLAPEPLTGPAFAMLGVTFWVALWWVSECLPIGATSLLPVLLLPVSGVLGAGPTASTYMDRFILLMMAGFMAALAIERWGLHRRMALWVLLKVGTSPRRLVLGMMVATAVASMWIANTAATLIMLPIGLALIARLESDIPDRKVLARFAASLCLAIAYGASIGGIGTPLGTPPNLIYLGAVEKHFGSAPGFLEWMGFAVPIAALLIAFVYLYFVYRVGLPSAVPGTGRELLLAEQKALGPASPEERRVALVFGLMVLLWVTRSVDLESGPIGWAPLLGLDKTVDDSTVAVLGAIALFAWPAPRSPGTRLLDWDTARRIPWDVVLLFGGGLALAKGFDASGLSGLIANALTGLSGLHPLVVMLVVALVVTFLTEVTSNTAITTLLMPILAAFGAATKLPPEVVMLPAALAASCAFMLPVATPPNAVVYGSGRIPMAFMARTGFWLNLSSALIVPLWLWLTT